jgi:hypothetical protein
MTSATRSNASLVMRRVRAEWLVPLGVLAIHAAAVWGYSGVFWGDIGRSSHEVERFALGEVPYRDFHFHYPPLGLWVEGLGARLIGTDRLPLSLMTTAIAALIIIASVRYSRDVLERVDVAFVTVGVVLALAYAQTNGAPLPLGLYSPAVLVGALNVAIAAMLFVRSSSSREGRNAEWAAVFAALAVLSKQDFWLPALFVVGATAVRERRVIPVVVFAAVTSVGIALIVLTAGAQVLLPLAGGFGHARLVRGQGFPSWERLTVEVFVLSLIGGAVALLVSFARRKLLLKPLLAATLIASLSCGLVIAETVRTAVAQPGSRPLTPIQDRLAYHVKAGNSLVRPAVGLLRERASRTPIPVLLPPLLLALLLLRWSKLAARRRTISALLLGFAMALRARRAFEGTEWFEFLLTLPVIAVSVELLLQLPEPEERRFRAATTASLAVLALVAYSTLGRGPGTGRHYPVATATLRGDVHVKPGEARDYRNVLAAIDSIDPARHRPLYAFGYAGGFNYFMKRRNPFPFTQDFYYSAFDADSVLARRPRGIILVDNPFLGDVSYGAARFDWRHWEQPRVAGPYGTYDRVRFDRLKADCPRITSDTTMFRIYACP